MNAARFIGITSAQGDVKSVFDHTDSLSFPKKVVVNLYGHHNREDLLAKLREDGVEGFVAITRSPRIMRGKLTQVTWYPEGYEGYRTEILRPNDVLISEK